MKSLFGRYLTVTVSLLLCSFLLSGTLFMWRSYTMSVENTREQLELKTKNIASMTITLLYNDTPLVREMYLSSVTQIFDEGFNVIICSDSGILLYYA
ncbi:MAG: hypothetical protein ACI4QB_09785, partial [Eubacteriales bacterium]